MKPLTILLALLLSSCQAIHRTPDSKVSELRVGMTTAEVEKLLGRPWHAIVRPFDTSGRETLEYLLTSDPKLIKHNVDKKISRSYHRVLVLEFVDGKLTPFRGAGHDRESDER